MSTLFKLSPAILQKHIAAAAVKSIDSVSTKGGKASPEPANDESFDAHMREKQSPQDYSYAIEGAFSEGHYTEF